MTKTSYELIGCKGRYCLAPISPTSAERTRKAIIRAVHDEGRKVTIQYLDNNSCFVFSYRAIDLIDD